MSQIQKYHHKISGPILDRIDLHVEMQVVDYSDLNISIQQENSQKIRERVIRARLLQSLKIARTIADLGTSETIKEEHIAEAIQYRTLNRNWFRQ